MTTPSRAGRAPVIDDPVKQGKATIPIRRWAPLGILIVLVVAVYATGLDQYLSLAALARHHAGLRNAVADHIVLGIIVYALVYIVVVALSLPGAAALSIIGGLLFGWTISAPVTVVAATIGATIVYSVVKTSLGAVIAERAGPFVKRLSGGFARDAFHYLLFLRLVPAFPFFAVNAVAGLCRVAFKPFVAATFLGIIPGSIAFAYLGTGLDSVIEAQMRANEACIEARGPDNCRFEIDPAALVTPQLLIALAALGVIALIPVAIKRWRRP